MKNNCHCLCFLVILNKWWYLVKVPLLFVQVGGQPISPLHVNHEVLHLTLEPLFGFLQRSTLGVHSLNLLLSLLKALGKLFPVKNMGILFLCQGFTQDSVSFVSV